MSADETLTQKTRFDLPGFTLPLGWFPKLNNDVLWPQTRPFSMFPSGVNKEHVLGGYLDRIHHDREIVMMQIMNRITETPGWEKKIFDEANLSQWWHGFNGSKDDVIHVDESTDGETLRRRNFSDQDVTPRAMTYVVKELQWKASIFRSNNAVNVFDSVVKSDEAILSGLRHALIDASQSLELGERPSVTNGGFENTFNPVDPSLYPLVYGRTRILPDQVISRKDSVSTAAGKGTPLRLNNRPLPDSNKLNNYYEGFQHLPCDVSLSGNGCRIVSYISNVHPDNDQAFYNVVEKIISKAIPLWNVCLEWSKLESNRIPLPAKPCLPESEDECTCTRHLGHDHLDNSGFLAECLWPPSGYHKREEFFGGYFDHGQLDWVKSGGTLLPEPTNFQPRPTQSINLRENFCDTGLQVIVKLETIELTPAHPTMGQGEWHLEGQSNEHICATAMYCYEIENMLEQSLGFLQRLDYAKQFGDDWLEHSMLKWSKWSQYLQAVFRRVVISRFDGNQIAVQFLGDVPIRQGRIITFPNYLQQKRSPLSLADKTKPGHCKMLILYLVDPHIRIISTANVAAQRQDWTYRDVAILKFLCSRLPQELVNMIEPYLSLDIHGPITDEESQWYRWKLEKDRKVLASKQSMLFETGYSR